MTADLDNKVLSTLAHHDAAIGNLSGRLTGVETGLKTLQGEVHSGFAGINKTLAATNSKLDKLDAQPRFEITKVLGTVKDFAVLIGACVAAIIWIVTGQFGAVIAKQDQWAQQVERRLTDQQKTIDKMTETVRWHATEIKRPN